MKMVIDLGGSVVCPNGKLDVCYIREFSKLIKELGKRDKIVIVVGGGKLARNYIKAAREFLALQSYLDMIGIDATRLNAKIIIASLYGLAYPFPPASFEELAKALKLADVVVMGGLVPGQTTDAVSAEVAEFINADMLIIGTDVKGVYDKDPKKYEDAKMFDRIKASELLKIVATHSFLAGESGVIDIVAAKLIERSKIKTYVIDIANLENFRNLIKGKNFVGTRIV